jgi:LysR family transcriptional regulator, nitrogen assimilation regulatory protein
MMDIRQLRYFAVVLESKSLSKASELLHVAQPALGAQIRNLERELGAKLLLRHSRGVAPTEAGVWLAQHAGHLLQQFDRVRQDFIDYATTPSGPVLLCVGRSLPHAVTATIAERCRRTFPNIQLRIVGGLTGQHNEADLALTFRLHDDTHFVSEPLVQDELLLVYSSKERQLPREICFHRVIERMLILPSESHYVRRLVETAALLEGRELKVYCDIDSLETTRELVKRGVANSILPVAWVREEIKEGKLRTAKIIDPTPQRTLYMHSSRHQRSSATEVVRREICAIVLEYAHEKTFGWTEINNVSDNLGSLTAAAPDPSLRLARERGLGASSPIQDVGHTIQSVAIKIAIQPNTAAVSDDKQTGTLHALAEPMVASRAHSSFAGLTTAVASITTGTKTDASSPSHHSRASRR